MSRKKEFYALKALKLLCEWKKCDQEFIEMIDFVNHIVKEHLIYLKEDDLNCYWSDCERFKVAFSSSSLTELRRHILLHAFHTKIKYQGQTIQSSRNFPNCAIGTRSRNIIPELPEPLICCWGSCLVEFECAEYFYRHVDCHSDIDAKENLDKAVICIWNDCNRKLTEKFKLREHLRSHTQEKIVACPTCGGMFASRTKFFDHLKRQLPVDENDLDNLYICEYCSRKFNSERLLRDHMRIHVSNYKCPFCDMTCPTPSSLRLHALYRHSDDKPLTCSHCEYRCKTESDLNKHLESHRSDPGYQCSEEGCTFSSRSHGALKAHFSKVHEGQELPKYSCHICNKVCTRGNYLTKHLCNQHKLKWPSGHCRFRYRMHDDGYYRLQTVRYESLGLTEMMEESSENIDDPSLMDPLQTSAPNQNDTCLSRGATANCPTMPFFSSNISNENSASGLSLQNAAGTEFQAAPHFGVAETSSTEEQKPVLIHIIDAERMEAEAGYSVLIVKTTKPVECDEIRSVQLVMQDDSGNIVVENAEIISQFQEPELTKEKI